MYEHEEQPDPTLSWEEIQKKNATMEVTLNFRKDHLEVMLGDIDTALSFLYDMADIIEEPYFNLKEYDVAINRLESLKKDLEG